MVSSFREVVELWDSPEALAVEVGASAWAVRKWKTDSKRRIPAEYWSSILRTPTAQRHGLTAELLAELAAREPAEPAEARA